MPLTRRELLKQSAAATLASTLPITLPGTTWGDERSPHPLIVDTHQHLWDLSEFTPPWLAHAPALLRRNYRTAEYLQATRDFPVQAIYMEVDLARAQHRAEVEHVVELSRSPEHPTIAAVVGGRPAAPDFGEYVTWLAGMPEVKGVRQVLHGAGTPPGYCLQKDFVRGIREMGEHGLRFDLCLRPAELGDGLKLTPQCPDTKFIIDHCGNADPKAFQKDPGDEPVWHNADDWRRDMAAFAQRTNVVCKISGIVARAPHGWRSDHLAPIVNHCLDTFGPDRVVFGGDWPVCLKGAPLREWIKALGEIISERPALEQAKLWHGNAQRIYALT